MGIGSAYFAARNASSPATLAITFGEGIDGGGDGSTEFILIINGIQYDALTLGANGTITTGYYNDDEEPQWIPFVGEYLATEFQSYINANFSSSLTVSRNANVVTLTTKATGPTANLNASCVLPMFPTVPLTGLSEISKFDFAGLSASDLARSGSLPAKYLTIGDASGNNHYFWWKSSTESDPSPVGIGHRIDYSLGDETYQLAQALITAAQDTTLWVGSLNEEAATLTTLAGGNVINASAGTTPVAVTTIKQGINITPTLINAVFVSGAGSEDANGLHIPNGTVNGRTRYTKVDFLASVMWDGTQYRIAAGNGNGDIFYYTNNGPANPWSGIYGFGGDGSDPVPTVRQATSADL